RSALNLYGIYSILKRTERTQYQPTGGPCNNALPGPSLSLRIAHEHD
ncbi:hypothetical protein SAMN04488512_13811, partial [Sulfitobacter litoralis]